MKLSLTVLVAGPMEGKKLPISGKRFTIGRDGSCDLQPGNPTIAPRHCSLEIRGEQVFLEDLGSSTGTFVNDQQITSEVELQNGDRFKVGPLIFGVTIEGVKKAPPAPAASTPPEPPPAEDSPAAQKSKYVKRPKIEEDPAAAAARQAAKSPTTKAAEELLKKMFRKKGDERPII